MQNYLTTLGMDTRATEKVLRKNTARETTLVQQKMADYQTLFQIDQPTLFKLIRKFPAMLGYDVLSDSPTSVKSKMKNFQTLLQTDAKTVAKMLIAVPTILGYDTVNDTPTSIKGKFKQYQTILHTDAKTLRHMITIFPAMLGYDTVSDNPTSVSSKCEYLKTSLQIDDQTLLKMLTKAPILLAMDTTSTGPSSLTAKIQKLKAVMPAEQMRETIITCPTIFTVPAQAFKIRYMLAENNDVMPYFLHKGFMTNQEKVWARACHLAHHLGILNPSNVYRDEKQFNRIFGVKSADLMRAYPLNQTAVACIEHRYYVKTGHSLTLDQQERAAIGLEK